MCLCNCCRCPSSERLRRRTGACLTARRWVKQSMMSGARGLTQCGKKRMQMRGEPTLIWKNRDASVFLNCAVIWHLWKTCTVSFMVCACTVTVSCFPSLHWQPATFVFNTSTARYLPLCHHRRMYKYIHTCIHIYLYTYRHIHIHDLSPPPLSFLPSLSAVKPLKLILGRN